MFRSFLLAIIWTLVTSACTSNDPCQNARVADKSSGSSLQIPIIEQTNTIGRQGNSIDCVNVTVLNSSNYADTLIQEILLIERDQAVISSLPPGTFDVIIDREDFFPVKLNDISVGTGENKYSEQVLMYRYDVSFAITGEIGFSLKPEATLKQVTSIYNVHSPARVSRVPGGYQIRLHYKGTKRTRKESVRLCRKLLNSPYIEDAAPLANFTTVVPGI